MDEQPKSYRFHLHDQPPALPGNCFICRSVNDSPFVDTGINEPFIGAIYIGKNCLKEMYSLIDDDDEFYTQQQVLNVRDTVERLAQEQFTRALIKVGDVLNDARTSLELGSRSVFPDALVLDFSDVEDSNEAQSGEQDGSGIVQSEPIEFDSGSVEGVSVDSGEGSDDVPSDSDDGFVDPGTDDGTDDDTLAL